MGEHSGRVVELSPVEKRGSLWFKREDLAGGQKGRQLRFMVEEYLTTPGPHGLLSSSPGTSPQITFSAREAARHGIPCIIVLGTNSLERAREAFPNVRIAEALGCEIVVAGASQNNWRRDRKFKALCELYPTYFQVPEGLGPCKTEPEWLQRFYLNSAVQVQNLPPGLKNLIIPTGSGNSAVSILLGLAEYMYNDLPENIILAVLGTTPEGEMRKTVDAHIRRGLQSSKLALHLYEQAERIPIYPKNEYGTKCRPAQSYEGIDFHPNYEAKVWKVLNEQRPDLLSDDTLFWIVGAEPKLEDFASVG